MGHVFCFLRVFHADKKVTLHLAGPQVNNALIVHSGTSSADCLLLPLFGCFLVSIFYCSLSEARSHLIAVIQNIQSETVCEVWRAKSGDQIISGLLYSFFVYCGFERVCVISFYL